MNLWLISYSPLICALKMSFCSFPWLAAPISPPVCAMGFIAPVMFFLSWSKAFTPSSLSLSSMMRGCSWLSPKTMRKQKETEETQLTSRLGISMPDCVMERNCCVREKGTLARTKPAKNELIHAMAGIVVNIITTMPFMLSIMPDCIAIMLFAVSVGGRSPFRTKYPSSALQRKVRRQSNASRVSRKYFLAKFSHFWTMALSLVSWSCGFLTGFLVAVQALQSVKQKRKSWMRQQTQMMGRNTQSSMRSSNSRSPIC